MDWKHETRSGARRWGMAGGVTGGAVGYGAGKVVEAASEKFDWGDFIYNLDDPVVLVLALSVVGLIGGAFKGFYSGHQKYMDYLKEGSIYNVKSN